MKYIFGLIFMMVIPMSFAESIDLEKHVRELHEQGVTVLPKLYNDEEIKAFRENLSPIVHQVESMMKTEGKPRIFHNDGMVTKTAYWQIENDIILQAGPGRFDTRYRLNKDVFAKDNFQHHPVIEQVVGKMLHSRFVNHTGVVYSAAGSGDQYWHRDTDNMADSDSDGTKLVQMDDFYYTVLIPLVPMTKENGTTEFMLGTHKKTAGEFAQAKKAQFDVALGDAIIFNGKIHHRGRANQSKEERPVLYNVYYKGWYNDSYREGIS